MRAYLKQWAVIQLTYDPCNLFALFKLVQIEYALTMHNKQNRMCIIAGKWVATPAWYVCCIMTVYTDVQVSACNTFMCADLQSRHRYTHNAPRVMLRTTVLLSLLPAPCHMLRVVAVPSSMTLRMAKVAAMCDDTLRYQKMWVIMVAHLSEMDEVSSRYVEKLVRYQQYVHKYVVGMCMMQACVLWCITHRI